jgi:hypothetical protein
MALGPASFSADCRVGRLVEARLVWLATPADVAAFVSVMQAAFAKAGPASVICADWRDAGVLPPEVGDALIDLLRRGNRHFARSAVLLPQHPTFSLQVERLFREAGNKERRAFRTAHAQLDWLSEVLTPEERGRAAEFLKLPAPSR